MGRLGATAEGSSLAAVLYPQSPLEIPHPWTVRAGVVGLRASRSGVAQAAGEGPRTGRELEASGRPAVPKPQGEGSLSGRPCCGAACRAPHQASSR